ncbi:DNA-binding protein [Brucella anthropi]|uniref:Arc family DNA-binding protein n=1 Tax=Brucella anthropi TaxID=529 RepID=UPI00044FE51B|nr:Arc family DNA-binding protein [Brucella anthropi]EXL06212.1 DNA-binding protein [Brucella anthropi]
MSKKPNKQSTMNHSKTVKVGVPITQSSAREAVANIPPFGLRMQPDLKKRVEEAAARNNRSINAEIVSTLEMFYPERMTLEDMVGYLKDLTEQSKGGSRPEIMTELEHVLELIADTIQKPDDK